MSWFFVHFHVYVNTDLSVYSKLIFFHLANNGNEFWRVMMDMGQDTREGIFRHLC